MRIHCSNRAIISVLTLRPETSEFYEHLRSLQHFASVRRGFREAQGAVRNSYQQVQVQVDGRQIKMKHYSEKSRELVAECTLVEHLRSEYLTLL